MVQKPAQKKQGDAAPEPRVEESILSLPTVASIAQSSGTHPLFQKFIDTLGPLLDLPRTSEFVLDAFSSRDVTAEKLAMALKGNVYFEQAFYRVVDALSKRKEGQPQPSLEAAIVLLGMQNSRNLILAIQMARNVLGTHPDWTPEGKLKTPPADMLKHALELEESAAGSKEEYFDLAFSAGMLFDMLGLICSAQEHKKELAPFVDATFRNGLKTAQIAAQISKTIPEFAFRRYFYAACVVQGVGKIVMAILDPSYLKFNEECQGKELPRAMRRYAETKRYGINHTVFGGLVCEYFKVFAPFARAILYQDEPFLLVLREKKLFDLCGLLSLSGNIASNFKRTDKTDDPIIEFWKTAELGSYKVDMGKVLTAIGKTS